MSDIVERLVDTALRFSPDSSEGGVMCDAADEIERLRALITEWADAEDAYFDIATDAGRERIKRLDAAEDALRKAVGR